MRIGQKDQCPRVKRMGQPMRREDGRFGPRLLSSVHELHIWKPQPREKMGPGLSRGLKPNGGLDGAGEVGQSAQSSCSARGRGGGREEGGEVMPTCCAASKTSVMKAHGGQTVGLARRQPRKRGQGGQVILDAASERQPWDGDLRWLLFAG